MSQRITVVFNDKNVKLLRNIQAKLTATSDKSVSFSSVVNIVLFRGLQGAKIK